ncbi:MAG: hypothetical protein WCJ11_10920 [Methylococcaceae bacterium]
MQFNQWLKVSRFVYNATIALLRDYEGDKKPSWMDIKKMFTRLLPDWTKNTPFQVKGMGRLKTRITPFGKRVKPIKAVANRRRLDSEIAKNLCNLATFLNQPLAKMASILKFLVKVWVTPNLYPNLV